jgi:hypothetical protein
MFAIFCETTGNEREMTLDTEMILRDRGETGSSEREQFKKPLADTSNSEPLMELEGPSQEPSSLVSILI